MKPEGRGRGGFGGRGGGRDGGGRGRGGFGGRGGGLSARGGISKPGFGDRGGRGGRGGGRGRGGGGRGGRGGGRGGGMKGGAKVMVEAHRHKGIFIAKGKEDALVTKNMVPGEAVYNEKRISVQQEDGTKIEYRVWNPFRSKLAAAVLGGVDNIWIQPGARVLYLGAASGTTVSHVSDIVGPEGCVYAVEFSHRSGRDLVNMAKKRTNVIPIIYKFFSFFYLKGSKLHLFSYSGETLMASLHTHRKLLIANPPNSNSNSDTNSPPDKDPTVQTCLYFCNLQRNNSSASTGFCPQACLAICPSVCQYSLSNVPFPPTSIPNKSQNLSPLLLCMLILLAVTFLMIALYVLYTKLYYHYYAPNSNSFLQTRTRRRRGESAAGSYSVDEEHRNRVVFHPFWCIPTVGLPPAEIHSIPIHKYGKEMEQRDCVVCLAEFEEGDELRVLSKCNHAFHIPCIDTWLSSHTTCPLCRSPIIPPDDHDHDYDRDNDQDHNHKDEDTSTSLTSVEGATENNYPAEVLGITITGREEEVENNTEDADHTEDTQNKDQKNLGRVDQGSSSQRWSLERGAANLLSRSLSCSGKIFSSRSNIRPNPNS